MQVMLRRVFLKELHTGKEISMVVDYKNVEWTKAEHFKGGENFIWLKVKDDG